MGQPQLVGYSERSKGLYHCLSAMQSGFFFFSSIFWYKNPGELFAYETEKMSDSYKNKNKNKNFIQK